MNLRYIAEAQNYYTRMGYTEVTLPWVAAKAVMEITLPPDGIMVNSDIGCLVGSAEQSFIQAVLVEKLSGKFHATTPCFRNEAVDALHKQYFIKTELFQNVNVNTENLWYMIGDAKRFFKAILDIETDVISIAPEMYDIVDRKHKIELGSYGIRQHPVVGDWIFGTGCAEPRASHVLSVIK